jgi:hypothetical protein
LDNSRPSCPPFFIVIVVVVELVDVCGYLVDVVVLLCIKA